MVHDLRTVGHVLGDLDAGHAGGNRLGLAAVFVIGQRAEGFELRRAALHPQQDAGHAVRAEFVRRRADHVGPVECARRQAEGGNLPQKIASAYTAQRKLVLELEKAERLRPAAQIGADPARMAELVREAGCAGMEIGSDSGADEVLKRLRKGFTTDQIRQIHELCKTAGIPDCHTFILGTQGETLDDVHKTLDFALDLDPFSAIIMMWVDDYEALDPALRAERMKLRDDIKSLLLERKEKYPYWSIPPLGLNFDVRLFRRLRRHGMHGPLWQFVRMGEMAD